MPGGTTGTDPNAGTVLPQQQQPGGSPFSRIFSGEGTPADFQKLQTFGSFLTGFGGTAGRAAERGAGTFAGIGQGFAGAQSFLQNALKQNQQAELLKLQRQKFKLDLSAKQRLETSQTKLREIMARPGALGPEGNPTPATIAAIRAEVGPSPARRQALDRAQRRLLSKERIKAAERRIGITEAGAERRQIARTKAADVRLDKQLKAREDVAKIKAKASVTAAGKRKRTAESARVRAAFFAETGLKGPLGAIRLGRGQGRSAQRIIAQARRLVQSGAAATAEEAFEQIRKTEEGAKLFADFNRGVGSTNKTPGGIPFKVK